MSKITLLLCLSLMLNILTVNILQAEEKYLSVEEKNRRAKEDMMRVILEMRAIQEGTYKPPVVDYTQYTNIIDFRNIFAGWQNNDPAQISRDSGEMWQQHERRRHQELIKKMDFTYVVLPVEDFSNRHDPISRLLAAKYIAQQLTLVSGKKTLEPELFLKGYGEKRDIFEAVEYAKFLPQKNLKIVHLFLKLQFKGMVHDPDSQRYEYGSPEEQHYVLAVVVSNKDGQIATFKQFILSKETAQEPLETKILQITDDIVNDVTGNTQKKSRGGGPAPQKGQWPLQGSFATIIQELDSPLDQAAYMQLLAMLTPNEFDSEKIHLFERSLLTLNSLAEQNDHSLLLTARALHYLHRRPMAIGLLKTAETAELKALKEYLKGNYYALKQAISEISDPLCYTLSFIELHFLARAYGKELPQYDKTRADSAWQELINNKIQEGESWYLQNTKSLADSMLEIYPPCKQIYKDILSSFNTTPYQYDDNPFAVDEQFILILGQKAMNEQVYTEILNYGDIINLLRNCVCSNQLRKLYRAIILRGSYDQGVRIAEKMAYIFKGFPSFSYLQATGIFRQGLQKNVNIRDFYLQESLEIACNGEKNSYPFEKESSDLRRLIKYIKRNYKLEKSLCSDFPDSTSFPSDQNGSEYTASNYFALRQEHKNRKLSDGAYQKILASRFNGHPQKIIDQAQAIRKGHGRKKAIAYLDEKTRTESQTLELYEMLGKYYLEEADFEKASRSFFLYRYFFNVPSEKRVEMSNVAYAIGNYFYSIGRYEEASPFYSFSSSLQTGAGSQMLSVYKLAIIDKAYDKAADEAFRLWERYRSHDSFGIYALTAEYLGLAVETEQNVLSLLKTMLADRIDKSEPLWSALRLHDRVTGKKLSDSLEDIKDIMTEHSSRSFDSFAEKEALKTSLIDRRLSPLIHEGLGKITRSSRVIPQETSLLTLFTERYPEIAEDLQKDYQKKEGKFFAPKNETSDLYFACMLMQQKKYNEAVKTFLKYDERAYRNLLQNYPDANFVFPYFLMSFSKSDYFSAELLREILKDRSSSREISLDSCDDYLVGAISHALENQTEQSLAMFQKSYLTLYKCTRNKLELSWYQLFQVAEWLTLYTHDHGFVQCALTWADCLQRTEPYLAWPYAFTALYETDKEKREAAAAYALYLDSKSKWLENVPENIKVGAQKRWELIRPGREEKKKAKRGLVTKRHWRNKAVLQQG